MNPRRKRLDPNTVVLLKQISYGLLTICTVSLIITGIWYGTRIQSLTISEVTISGGETISKSEVEDAVREPLEGNYLGLIPRKFAWFYPEEEVLENVKKIERINNIFLQRESGTELSIKFDEYVPAALWCKASDVHECVFIDKSSFAFTRAPDLGGGFFVRFVRVAEDYSLRENFLNQEDFDFLVGLAGLLSEIDWAVSSIEVDKANDAFLRLSGGGELKVAIVDSPASVIENLKTILVSEEFSHLKPGNFQYIDLRFGNKIFVNEEEVGSVEENETSTSTSGVEG
ncbi:hypothetical protein KC926_03400 [Candidatus Kaiserbacteria bacterium]|nr:hypothetical protein [Candidatus Kaiserbacteria bacterium]